MIDHYDEHDNVTQFPEASKWQATFAARGTRPGLGFFLFDSEGKPIAAAFMNAQQALAQGKYLVENAQRMLEVEAEARAIQQAALDKAVANIQAVTGMPKTLTLSERVAKALKE